MCGLREHLMSLDHVSHSCESHNQSALQVIVPSDIKSFTWLGDRALFPGGADTTCPPGYAPSYLQGGAPGLWPDPCYSPRPPPAPALLLLFAWLGSRRSPPSSQARPPFGDTRLLPSWAILACRLLRGTGPASQTCFLLRAPATQVALLSLRQFPEEWALVPSRLNGQLNTAAAITPRGRENVEPSLSLLSRNHTLLCPRPLRGTPEGPADGSSSMSCSLLPLLLLPDLSLIASCRKPSKASILTSASRLHFLRSSCPMSSQKLRLDSPGACSNRVSFSVRCLI